MKQLNNKIAIVTGGGRGIGKQISLKLASLGAKVVITYEKDIDSAKATVELIKSNGCDAISYKMSVENRADVKFIFNKINTEYGNIDILVNNAGINKPTDFNEVTDDDWDKIINVNLKGPFICSQEFFNFCKNNNGNIINIGSVSGQYGGPRTAHYAASKAGLISLSQVIARYGAKFGVRCNTIAAGLIESEMASVGMQSSTVIEASKNIILKRFGTTTEVANTVAFLASDESSYITAQTINVNGGLYF